MGNALKKTASVVAAFALAAATFATPVQAESGFMDKFQGFLDDPQGSIDAGAKKLSEKIGDGGTSATGLKAQDNSDRYPTFSGQVPGVGTVYCYNRASDGTPDPNELARVPSLEVVATGSPFGEGTIGPRHQGLGRDINTMNDQGRGHNSGLVAISGMTIVKTSSCAKLMERKYISPVAEPGSLYGGRPKQKQMSRVSIRCGYGAGQYPADDADTTLDFIVTAPLHKGGRPMVRCNSKEGVFKPLKPGDTPFEDAIAASPRVSAKMNNEFEKQQGITAAENVEIVKERERSKPDLYRGPTPSAFGLK
ncbi:MAG: hypothetical protein WBK08_16650 [Nitrospira sp.]